MPGNGVKYSSLDDFNAELGSTDDPLSNLKRYGKRIFLMALREV
jgi:hypothetical protein